MDKRLLLWDVDHTLIDTGGVGRAVYQEAFEQVTGRPMKQQTEVSGRTEPDIFRDTLASHDIEFSRSTCVGSRMSWRLATRPRSRCSANEDTPYQEQRMRWRP